MINKKRKREIIKDLLLGKTRLETLKEKKIRFETDSRGVEYQVIPGDEVSIYLPHNNRRAKETLIGQTIK